MNSELGIPGICRSACRSDQVRFVKEQHSKEVHAQFNLPHANTEPQPPERCQGDAAGGFGE